MIPQNILRTIRRIALLLPVFVVVALLTVLLLVPEAISDFVQSFAPLARLVVVIVMYALVVLGIYLGIRRSERQISGLVVKARGALTVVSTESARDRVLAAVRELDDVTSADAQVTDRRGRALIALDVKVGGDSVSLPEKQKEITRILEKVIEKQLGVEMADRPTVQIGFTGDAAASLASAAAEEAKVEAAAVDSPADDMDSARTKPLRSGPGETRDLKMDDAEMEVARRGLFGTGLFAGGKSEDVAKERSAIDDETIDLGGHTPAVGISRDALKQAAATQESDVNDEDDNEDNDEILRRPPLTLADFEAVDDDEEETEEEREARQILEELLNSKAKADEPVLGVAVDDEDEDVPDDPDTAAAVATVDEPQTDAAATVEVDVVDDTESESDSDVVDGATDDDSRAPSEETEQVEQPEEDDSRR